MSKNKGPIFVVAGAVLIMAALLLLLYNRNEDMKAGKRSDEVYRQMQELIGSGEGNDNPTLTEVEINGYNYIGYLSIPDLELNLPVMSDWDYTRLKIAPCRQFGSSKSDDLVIAAHNYKKHFGRFKELAVGAYVVFTDMDGNVNIYSVSKIETLDPTDVETVQNSGYDLVLYTCTVGGGARVTLFCDRLENVSG